MERTHGIIQVGWPGGKLTLRYADIPKISEEAQDEIKNTMKQFSNDCQMMLIWFVGVLSSREAIRNYLEKLAQQDEFLTIDGLRPDGRVGYIFAKVQTDKVIDAFSDAGEFENLYAKAFVVFTSQTWEEVARPKIATALKVKSNNIDANFMGNWRYLRNWIMHRTEEAERKYFKNAKGLTQLLGSQPGEPNLTSDKVFILMQHLNRMSIDVNPNSVEFGIEPVALDPGTIAEIAKTIDPGAGIIIPPEAAMYPSSVVIVLNGPTATIHELDCSHVEAQCQVYGARWLRVVSMEVAYAVIEHLGNHENRCEYCRTIEG